jgi:hypothetical protein
MYPFKLKTIFRPRASSVYDLSTPPESELWAGFPGTLFGKSNQIPRSVMTTNCFCRKGDSAYEITIKR